MENAAPLSAKETLDRLSADRAFASYTLFKHRHPQEEAPLHVEMMDLFASADELVEVEAFREAGKSTKLEEHTILAGCFGNFHYGLWGGETYEKSCQRLAAIDLELRTNEKLHAVFGGEVLARKSNENKIWFKSGTVLQAFGWEQELQSFKEGTHRPDFCVLDDVENRERVRDRKSVAESMAKLYEELLPAMDQTWHKVINSQVRLAEHCMVTELANDPEWLYRGYPICIGDCEEPGAVATWPQRYPLEWIRKLKRRYARQMSAFLRVYMLQAVNPATKPFKSSMFKEISLGYADWMPRRIIYDPSRTTNEKRTREGDQSARTGKVVISQMGSKIIVHESGGFFWKPSELIEDVFAANDEHRPVKLGIEKDSLDEWLLEPLRLKMLRTGKTLPLVALNAPQDQSKEEFVGALQPFFDGGDIHLVGGRLAHPQLCAETDNWPQGLRDVLNALAYAPRIFAGIPVYEDFNGSNIGEAPVPKNRETVFVAFNASPTEVVAVAVVREMRRLHVARDWSQTGTVADAVRGIGYELRASFPSASFQAWVPSETMDAWQRIPLLPALRTEKLAPYRGEHVAVARGALADRLRNEWLQRKLLIVDRKAVLTINALSAGYALPLEKGGRTGQQPEPGTSRLLAEALECMITKLDAIGDQQTLPKGANIGHTQDGHAYISARPERRT